ncbi:MAG: flagellar hook-basal body complex protein [bacterium]|nr:flagellar hook-basal body complex protein [bacterium]
MIGSFFSGVSGLKAHLTWLDVIGENLANIDSTGFKRSRVSFEDILNQNFKSAVAPRGDVGGMIPMQVGLGTTLATIQTIFTQGKLQPSEKNTDLAINGANSFFIVSDGISDNYRYTRAGSFDFDKLGSLVNPSNGFKVLGWNALRDPITGQLIKDSANRTIIDTTNALTGVEIVRGDIMPGKATESVEFKGDLKSTQSLPIDATDLSFIKGVSSVVPVSKNQNGIDINKEWKDAGFNETPDGKIIINKIAFKVGGDGGWKTPNELMNAINISAQAQVTIKYENDRFSIIPDNDKVQVSLAEVADTSGNGFFTQAFITAGTEQTPFVYNTSNKLNIQFEHLLDANHPDRNYYRWKAVDPTTTEFITTNAYFFERGDTLQGPNAMDPGGATGKQIGVGDSVVTVFDLGDPDIDPASLDVYVTMPDGTAMIVFNGKTPMSALLGVPGGMGGLSTIYYFDDDGADARFGPSSNGVDRIVFCYAPPAGATIKVDYERNGFNMHNSTVDPTRLQVKINGQVQPGIMYKFRNNQGVGGNDEVTFYSVVSNKDVVNDILNVSKPFDKAGFNWNVEQLFGTTLVPRKDLLMSSQVTFKWNGGTWTSPQINTFASVENFMSLVKTGTSGIVSLSYDTKEDKFFMKNTQAISMVQTNAGGFLSAAKLKGEGFYSHQTAVPAGKSWVSVAANENPQSREKIVKNNLDLTQSFLKAGFNNNPPALDSGLSVIWEVRPGSWAAWSLSNVWSDGLGGNGIGSGTGTVQSFINIFNDAHSGNAVPPYLQNEAMPLSLRYDPKQDRFQLVNTNRSDCEVKIRQNSIEGFLTKGNLLTSGLAWVDVPHSPVEKTDIVTADYYYNKTVEARGILQLDKDGRVIDNFVDTEASPVIYSSAKILNGNKTLDLSGGWDQFEGGTVDGTIKITSKNGIYTSRTISSSYYPTINTLLDEINASQAKVVITYHADMDKFSIRSREQGDEIILEETGLHPFFSATNIAIGKKVGGNNNSVMDLEAEVPGPEDGWGETTGLFGTGRDFFKVNIMPNIVRSEDVGEAGKGRQGTQVIDEGVWRQNTALITLNNADVDKSTILVRNITSGNEQVLSRNSWIFKNGGGQGGRDQIEIKGGITTYSYLVSYTRLNSFDLDNPDVDETTLSVKVDGRIISRSDWVFEDNMGSNGVDRILLQPNAGSKYYQPDPSANPNWWESKNPGTLGSGQVTVDYRKIFPEAVDVFIPNGNNGPEDIVMEPNVSETSYPGNAIPQLADSGVKVTSKLKLTSQYQSSAPQEIYDAFGNPQKVNFLFERLSFNKWLWSVMNPVEKEKIAGYGVLAFTGKGLFDEDNSEIFESPSDPLTPGLRYKGIYFDPPSTPTPPEFNGAPPPEKGADPSKISPKFNQITQLSSNPSTVKVSAQDGYKIGKLKEEEMKINSEGVVVASYDNGQTQDIAQIALANFDNPSGLDKLDGTTFAETVNSGTASIGKPKTEGRNAISPGQLEKSNVDLVQEFADMIIAQRAFQANSRTVTTADQMFIDIIAMKRL